MSILDRLLGKKKPQDAAKTGTAPSTQGAAAYEPPGPEGYPFDVLVRRLRDENLPEIQRYMAAEALGKGGNPAAVEPLTAALKDPNATVRGGAAQALGTLRRPEASPALVEALRDPDWSVRRRAGDALKILGVPEDPRVQATYYVAQGLYDQAAALGEVAIDPLVNVLDYLEMSSKISRALAQIGSAALPPLLEALKNGKKWTVRCGAARALGALGNPGAREALKAARKDPDENVREDAAEALQLLRG